MISLVPIKCLALALPRPKSQIIAKFGQVVINVDYGCLPFLFLVLMTIIFQFEVGW